MRRCFRICWINNFNGEKEKISVEDINECLGLINLNTLFSFSKSIAEKTDISAIEN